MRLLLLPGNPPFSLRGLCSLVAALLAFCFCNATALAHDQEPIALEDMVVTQSRLDEYVKNYPQQLDILQRESIQQGHYHKVSEALASMPGVDATESVTGGTRIAIRGAGQGHVLVLVNGRPAGATQYGSADINSIPMEMVERIEVYKPPIPVWLGAGGSNGAVNIVLQQDVKRKKAFTGRAEAYGGSRGKVGGSASGSFKVNDHALGLSAGASHQDGFRVNSDRDTAKASVSWQNPKTSPTRWDGSARYYHSEHGSPGRTDNPTPDARQQYNKGSADLRARGFFNDQAEYEVKVFGETLRLEDESQSGLTSLLDSNLIGIKEETTIADSLGKWALRFGGNGKWEGADHTLSGDHERTQGGLHGQFDRDEGAFTWTLGVRGDLVSDFDFQPGATVGVGVPVGKGHQIKARAGYTTHVPTFGQLYQPAHGSIDQVRGNPDLIEERIVSCSLGWQWDISKKNRLECTLFREDVWDKIQYDDYSDLIKRPVNLDRTNRTGAELALSWTVGAVGLEGSYVLQTTENEHNGKDLPYSPAHTFKLTVKSKAGPWKTRLEGVGRVVSDQYSDISNTEEKQVDAYASFDAKAVQPFSLWGKSAEAYVKVQNLLDANYETHHGYPDDGFRFTAGLSMDF